MSFFRIDAAAAALLILLRDKLRGRDYLPNTENAASESPAAVCAREIARATSARWGVYICSVLSARLGGAKLGRAPLSPNRPY